MSDWQALQGANLADLEYQTRILQGVSRTFALTIPQLPPVLCKVVGNAYLLCRIADTIEDEASLGAEQKRYFAEKFIDVVAGRASPHAFADELLPLLSNRTLEPERDLVRNTPRVIRLTHGFTANQRAAIGRCIAIMADGMAWFQGNRHSHGLKDLLHLDRYCYYVAGVVGEMLTELFCDYSEDIRKNRQKMLELAVSFGQGLQMTNILKDVWEDRSRGACWLPQDIFRETGFDLKDLSKERYCDSFGDGLEKLIAIANGHLKDALSYTLLIPKSEKGIRKFCFWALGMALLTLRKINRNRSFTAGSQVKISRRAVKVTILATNMTVGSNWMPRLLFSAAATGLPARSSVPGSDALRLRPHPGSEVNKIGKAVDGRG